MTAAEHTARLAQRRERARNLYEAQANHAATYERVADSGKIREWAVHEAIGAGWTQREVAEAMGVSYQLVSRIASRR